jgi:hypothetical protein
MKSFRIKTTALKLVIGSFVTLVIALLIGSVLIFVLVVFFRPITAPQRDLFQTGQLAEALRERFPGSAFFLGAPYREIRLRCDVVEGAPDANHRKEIRRWVAENKRALGINCVVVISFLDERGKVVDEARVDLGQDSGNTKDNTK